MGGWHEAELRVRYEETDRMGVVYYAKFFVWMEVGRVSLFRDVGLQLPEIEKRRFGFPVVQAHADYRAPARFDDEVLVKTRVASIGRSSIRFENEIHKLPGKQLLCLGYTVHVLVGGGGKPVTFPEDVKAKLTSS